MPALSDTDSIDAKHAPLSQPRKPTMTTIRSAAFVTLVATASIVMAGVIVTSTASPYQAPSASSGLVVVHLLPRVVVTGEVQRSQVAQIVELPRVVVTGRRVDATSTMVAQDDPANAGPRT